MGVEPTGPERVNGFKDRWACHVPNPSDKRVSGCAKVLEASTQLAAYHCSASGLLPWKVSVPTLLLFPMAARKARAKQHTYPQDEFGNFTNLLDKLLAVPHSKIKAELDAEKRKKRTQKKRAAVGHAFRDAD